MLGGTGSECKRVACQRVGEVQLRLGSRNERKNESCPLAGVLCKATKFDIWFPFPALCHRATQTTTNQSFIHHYATSIKIYRSISLCVFSYIVHAYKDAWEAWIISTS